MKTTARLTYDKIRFDEPKDLHLLVELHAPPVDWQSKRPPVCVLPVIDVSGSMAGAKLHFAKQSVMKLIDHLAPGDFCGLVTFTTDVRVIDWKASPKRQIRRTNPVDHHGHTHPVGPRRIM